MIRLEQVRSEIAARRRAAPSRSGPALIGDSVAKAIATCPEDALMVPEIWGCVEVAAVMSWEAVARRAGLPITDETRESVMGYLLRGFTAMTLEFSPEHFQAEKAQHEQAMRLKQLARERKPEIEAEMARRRSEEQPPAV